MQVFSIIVVRTRAYSFMKKLQVLLEGDRVLSMDIA